MTIFFRMPHPPAAKVGKYRHYRDYVRSDFCECCAYCLLHEILAAGSDNFELDHFRPKSIQRFRHLADDYYNLYYSCHKCNHFKASSWPSQALQERGYRFIDFCSELHSDHFRENSDGEWVPLSAAAEYTSKRLRLNRKHLLQIRSLLREIACLNGVRLIDWDQPCREQIKELKNMLLRFRDHASQ